jgi:hypothetical protein
MMKYISRSTTPKPPITRGPAIMRAKWSAGGRCPKSFPTETGVAPAFRFILADRL